MSLADDALGRDLLARFATPVQHVVLVAAAAPEPVESLQERREAWAAAAALLGLRVELGPLELTAEPTEDPDTFRVVATQTVKARRG